MFETQSITFFDNGINLGHAVIIMNRNNHASKFKLKFLLDVKKNDKRRKN